MKRFVRTVMLAVGAIIAWLPIAQATPTTDQQPPPNFGRFLNPPSRSRNVFRYLVPAPTEFDRQVTCGNLVCGEIRFDYAPYLGKPNGMTRGGAVLSGGFYLAPGLMLAPGDRLAWVQTVVATRSGENAWGINPAAGPFEFPDASRTSPAYPFTNTAAPPPTPPGRPTLGFNDAPSRRFVNGNQFWLAELGLVCIDGSVKGVTQAFAIDTFLWGFRVDTNPNTIVSIGPAAFGPPTRSYLATLNSYYSGMPPNPPSSGGMSAMFNFQAGCDDCFIPRVPAPEPATYLLLLAGVLGIAGVRHINRRSSSGCGPRQHRLQHLGHAADHDLHADT
jgi:hypothetical protein